MAPGHFVYAQLHTPDQSQAKAFYAELFGWEIVDDPPGSGPPYAEVLLVGERIAGVMASQEGGLSPQWLSYVAVEDVDAAAARASSLGASIIMPPMDLPAKGCRVCVITDPTGVALALRGPLAVDGRDGDGTSDGLGQARDSGIAP